MGAQESEILTSPPDDAEAPKRKRRGLLITAIIAGALIWILLILGIFVARYKPLASDTFGPISRAGSSGGSITVLDLTYEHGEPTGYVFELRNSGRYGVRINQISPPNAPGDLLLTTGVSMSRELDSCCSARPQAIERFHPFTLGSGHSIGIVVRQRFANCARFDAGSSETFDLPMVSFKILGITKHQLIAPWQVRVASPPNAGCPARSS